MQTHPQISLARKAAFAFLLLLITLMTWSGSGTREPSLIAMLWASSLCFATLAFFLKRGERRALYANYFFIGGMFFTALAFAATFNYSHELLRHDGYSVVRKLDHIAWLPSTVRADFGEGSAFFALAQILSCSFAAAAAFVLFKSRRLALYSLIFFAASAAAMGVFAMLQRLMGVTIMYGYFYSAANMYGTFFLGNASAAYLCMGMSACLALFFVAISASSAQRRMKFSFLSLGGAALCFASILLSKSNGATVTSLIVLAAFSFAILRLAARKAKTSLWKAFLISLPVMILFACGIGFAYEKSSNADVQKRIAYAEGSLAARVSFYRDALPLLKECGFWGTGASSFAHLGTAKMIRSQLLDGRQKFLFSAHAHCDILEYVIEYGWAGLLALAAIFAAYMRRVFKTGALAKGPNFMLMSGMAACFAHSCLDLHLHILSTMLAFCLLAAWSTSNFQQRGKR